MSLYDHNISVDNPQEMKACLRYLEDKGVSHKRWNGKIVNVNPNPDVLGYYNLHWHHDVQRPLQDLPQEQLESKISMLEAELGLRQMELDRLLKKKEEIRAEDEMF